MLLLVLICATRISNPKISHFCFNERIVGTFILRTWLSMFLVSLDFLILDIWQVNLRSLGLCFWIRQVIWDPLVYVFGFDISSWDPLVYVFGYLAGKFEIPWFIFCRYLVICVNDFTKFAVFWSENWLVFIFCFWIRYLAGNLLFLVCSLFLDSIFVVEVVLLYLPNLISLFWR